MRLYENLAPENPVTKPTKARRPKPDSSPQIVDAEGAAGVLSPVPKVYLTS